MPERKTGAFRFIVFAGLEPADPDRPSLAVAEHLKPQIFEPYSVWLNQIIPAVRRAALTHHPAAGG